MPTAILESGNAKDFYAWFHQQEIKPKERPVNPFKEPEGDGDDPATKSRAFPRESSNDDQPASKAETSEAEKSDSKTDGDQTPEKEPAKESSDKPDDAPKSDPK